MVRDGSLISMGLVTRNTLLLRILFAFVFAASLCGVTARAQTPANAGVGGVPVTVVDLPTPLLPDKFLQWSATAAKSGLAREAVGTNFVEPNCAPMLPDASGAGNNGSRCAAILAEAGLSRFAVARYGQAAGGAPLDVWAEQFVDATGAYSAYTFYRSLLKDARSVAGSHRGSESVADADGTLVLAGTSILHVSRNAGRMNLDALSAALPKVGGRKAQQPLLPTLLPKQGLEQASVRYALGPMSYQTMSGVLPAGMLSWDKSAESATANYVEHGSRGELTLLLYPTPQIAGDRGRVIEKAVNDLGPGALGMVKMRRVGPLIGITSGGFKAEQAAALIAGLHLSEEVTFDKKMPLEFHTEVKKTASLLQNIAVLSGVLILAAVLLGLFLGGARAGIRVLLGKPAASEPEFLSINLRDKPKALFSDRSREEKAP